MAGMPKSRRRRKSQKKATSRSRKTSVARAPKSRKKLVIAGSVAVAIVAVSVFLGLNWGSLFGGPSTTAIDWSLYGGTRVRLKTTMGDFTVQLRTDKPITTANFLNLTTHGLFDNTLFDRVIAGFVIQGGEIENASIPNISDEIGTANHNYNSTIAMANTGAPNSASSPFFINVADNNKLYDAFDKSYTVFGRVIDGMDVVVAISRVATDMDDRPIQNVTLIKAEVLP